jgi:hypothetical protein
MRTANSHSESVKTHLETFLAGLDSSDVTSDTTTNDDHIVLCYIGVPIISRCPFFGSAGTVSRMPLETINHLPVSEA